ncbi:hypothetical protein M3J09_013395 [Ascochyta lentis]
MTERRSEYKKFATPPIKSACTSCRASRVRCSGGNPCTRCMKRSRPCTFTISQRGRRSAATPTSPDLNTSNNPSTRAIGLSDSSPTHVTIR